MANNTGKKFGGRKKGTPNKAKTELLERVREKFPDYCPIEQICAIATDPRNDVHIRLGAAKEVAAYIYPKLKAVEHSGANGGNIIVETVQFSTRK